MVSKSTIENDIWQVVFDIIKNDTTVKLFVNNNVYSSYPSVFIEDAGGLPFVIIHRPRISEDTVTLGGVKIYPVTIEIHCVHKRAKEVKQLADAVRNALQSNVSTTESNNMHNFEVVSETEDFDFRDKMKIHYNILEVSYEWHEA